MPLANILTSEVSIFPLCGPKDLSDGVVGYQNVWRYGLQVRGNGDYERTNKRISQQLKQEQDIYFRSTFCLILNNSLWTTPAIKSNALTKIKIHMGSDRCGKGHNNLDDQIQIIRIKPHIYILPTDTFLQDKMADLHFYTSTHDNIVKMKPLENLFHHIVNMLSLMLPVYTQCRWRALLHPMRNYNGPLRPKHYQSCSSPMSAHYPVINESPGDAPPCMTNDKQDRL